MGLTSSPALLSLRQLPYRGKPNQANRIKFSRNCTRCTVRSSHLSWVAHVGKVYRAVASVPCELPFSLPRPSSLIGLRPPLATCFLLYIVLSFAVSLLGNAFRLVLAQNWSAREVLSPLRIPTPTPNLNRPPRDLRIAGVSSHPALQRPCRTSTARRRTRGWRRSKPAGCRTTRPSMAVSSPIP